MGVCRMSRDLFEGVHGWLVSNPLMAGMWYFGNRAAAGNIQDRDIADVPDWWYIHNLLQSAGPNTRKCLTIMPLW